MKPIRLLFVAKIAIALAIFCTLFQSSILAQNNAIVNENTSPGNPPSEWDITGAGDLNMQGFATDISVNKGETVHFKIKSPVAYTIDIYRLGYYQGNGARNVGTGVITATLPQTQPTDLYDAATGLTDCGNWAESAHWDVPSTAVSGIYIARLKRANGNASHIVFIVRDDASHSDLFFQTSDATWQAYNAYGGNSLYVGITSFPSGHAAKVSYNRPFITRNGGGGGGASEDWLFNAEYPMLRWLERNGYDVTYTTNVDAARSGNLIQNHKAFLSVGHDEYWSAEQRANVEAARNAGVHLAFFSGNECYWKTRWEPSTDGSGTAYRTLVCYKEGTLGENVCGSKCDPLSNVWTGLWRDGCSSPSADGCRPENALSGQISWDGNTGTMQVPDTYKSLRFWRNTSIATLGSGQTATLTNGTLGYEWDWEQFPNSYPAGRVRMSSTTLDGHVHHLSLYRYSNGALVFGAGSVQWSWGLDNTHDRGSSAASTDMQQATLNLFADMGVQPATRQANLVAATQSTDVQPPTSVITAPLNGGNSPVNNPVTVTGTASDVGGGVVAGVEVSVNGGTTWVAASGTNTWTYTFTPSAQGQVTIKTRAVDDIGNLETPGAGITVTIGAAGPVVCPCNIWNPSTVPVTSADPDNQPTEIGVKFHSTVNGYITGIRYYKSATNTGTHIGTLWASNGDNLAQATFTNESSTGWQEVTFNTPVAIVANTTYVASYHTTTGHYAEDDFYFANNGFAGSYLYALANGEDGPNGVYTYSAVSAFPTQTFNSSNYWVDVVFNTNVGPDVTPPTVTSTVPVTGASGVAVNAPITINFSEALDPSSVGSSTVELNDPSDVLVYASVSYNAGTRTITLTPVSPLEYSTTYTVKIKGGSTDPRIKDIAGNALQNNYTWSFTTSSPPPPPPTDGPGGPVLLISSTSNPFSRYPVEILRAEGFNEFTAMDISQVDAGVLNNYDVVIVGNISLSAGNVTMLTNWVNAGGTLIALKPDPQLAILMGLTSAGSTLSDKYLLVNTASGPGAGIVNQTIQFHGPADLYTLNGATSLATLYSNATTATTNPAVTMRNVGANGGVAVAFTYDLARSVVYTHQGNPAWAGQKRDGQIDPIRSDDMFFPDWIDFNKVAIPQADEQQHLLSNIILKYNLHRKPLPRFWFLPKGLKAAVVMTGDDHGNGGTVGRFNQYVSLSSSNTPQAVADWTAVRGTSYIYPNTPITNAQIAAFQAQGFEIALHLLTNCEVWTPASLESNLSSQLSQLSAQYPSVTAPVTNRTHCISWSDWASEPKIELAHGIRLDANYYYWPDTWIQNRPGMFTGSGQPMRFADLDGTLIDCYQVVTQMPDESGEVFPGFVNALLDKAVGPEGYYGVFCANMHTDNASSSGSDAIIASAQARQIPVVSSKQMLTWLDGRNASSFGSITWNTNQLSFTVTVASGANNIMAMLPVTSSVGQLTGITLNGGAVLYQTQTIKGIQYAFFNAAAGNYVANYALDNTPPVITNVVATPHGDGTATITWTTDEPSDSKVDYGTVQNTLSLNSNNPALVLTHSITLSGLTSGTTYYYKVTSADAANNSASQGSPVPFNFVMPSGACAQDQVAADFNLGTPDANTLVALTGDGAVILKPNLNQEFSGTTVPAGWTSANFNGTTTTVADGSVTVNGTHIYTNSTVPVGSSLEFVATYNLGTFQNVGLSLNQAFDAPWVTIGQGGTADGNLYARTSDNSTGVNLGSNLLGSAHRFRIQWNATNFTFYVDGSTTPAATLAISPAPSAPMYVQISDVNTGDGTLSVDWLRVTPYPGSGSYTSRVFDQGAAAPWGAATWNAAVPTGTSLSVFVHTGNTAVPDGTWSSFVAVTNGGNVGTNSRYLQYRADLATTNTFLTPELQDITIACNASADNTPPVITNVIAAPSADGTSATITWTTDEAANTTVDYGTTAGSLSGHVTNATLLTSHSIVLTGLTPSTTYYFRVTSADGSANSSTVPNPPSAPLSFATPAPACFTDQVVADFAVGTLTNTYVSNKVDGEVTLNPSVASEFNTLPPTSEWSSFAWSGGTSTVSGGKLVVDGARYNTEPVAATFGPGSVLEFVATFGAAQYQHIGFGGGSDDVNSGGIYTGQSPWAMFSTQTTSTTLFARTSTNGSASTDVSLGSSLLGTPHLYRIEWTTAGTFKYYVDGALVNTDASVITSGMRPAVSDYNNGGPTLQVDWIHVTPYATSGIFESRVYNAGGQRSWGNITWTGVTSSGETSPATTLTLSVHTGNTAIPDGSWTPYTVVANNGAVGATSRYIQYKAVLTTASDTTTPVLNDVSVSCSAILNTVPVVTTQPSNQTVCAGSTASFTSAATGTPTPTVQWQVSINGGNTWNNISGATNGTLSFNTVAGDNGKQYRAVWTNTAGNDISSPATLTINTAPNITLNPVNQTVCAKTAVTFSITASGTGLTYRWRKNGTIISGATSSSLTLTNVKVTSAGDYDVIVSGTCSPAVTSTKATLIINALPTLFTITAGGVFDCSTTNGFPVGLSGSQTGVSYQLKHLDGTIKGDPISGTGSEISFGNQPTGTYFVLATNTSTGCSLRMSGNARITRTGTKPAKPGAITPASDVTSLCGGGNFTFNIADVPGALSYVWTPVTGGSVISNNGTSAVLSFPANFTTGTIKVQAANYCGISLASSLTVNAVTKPKGISGSTSVTPNQTNVVYNVINPDPTVTYQWAKPSGVTIVSGQNTPTLTVNWGTGSGAIRVRTNNNCGTSTYVSLSVTVVSSLVAKSGVADVKSNGVEMSVSPNPTNGKAWISFTAHVKEKYTIEVRDAYGKLLLYKDGITIKGRNQAEIDMSNKPNAVYFVTLVNKEIGQKTMKLIKAK